jgi:hypothetical protein
VEGLERDIALKIAPGDLAQVYLPVALAHASER